MDGKPTVAYLWARTVTCKNCRATLPLLKTRWLCKKDKKRVLLTMEPNADRSGVVFGVQANVPVAKGSPAQRREHDKKLGAGTMSRAGAICPCCGSIMTMEDIRLEGRSGQLGATMTAVVIDVTNGKQYRLPTEQELRVADAAAQAVGDVFHTIPFDLPRESLPNSEALGARLPLYGFDQWHKLFVPRQLLALGTFVAKVRSSWLELRATGYSNDWMEALGAYLALAVARLADAGSTIAHWQVGVEAKPKSAPAQMTRVAPDGILVEKPIRLELVRIPAGYFLMGTRAETIPDLIKRYGGEQKWYERAVPQHQVYLPDYYIARVPVTVAQFRAFFEATGYQTTAEQEGWSWVRKKGNWGKVTGTTWRHPFGPESDVLRKNDHPVTQVSWHDVRAFCQWAGVRLPTEAEWEKAARGTDGIVFPWGNEAPTPDLCNVAMNVGDTTPVGKYAKGASPYGLLDMAGNVWEWTSSLYKPYPYDPKDGREDPEAEGNRVLRGGSWSNSQDYAASSFRVDDPPDVRNGYCGVRVVAGLAPPF